MRHVNPSTQPGDEDDHISSHIDTQRYYNVAITGKMVAILLFANSHEGDS